MFNLRLFLKAPFCTHRGSLGVAGTPQRIREGESETAVPSMFISKHSDGEEGWVKHLVQNGCWVTLRHVSCLPWEMSGWEEETVAYFIYTCLLFSYLVRGMTAFSALQRNRVHTLNTVAGGGRKLRHCFLLNKS